MNEQELRYAMRGVMTATQPPPPMSAAAVLDTAKRAQRHRRATLAGAASAVAVVLIAVGAIVVSGVTGNGNGPSQVGAGGPGVEPTDHAGTATADPSDTKTAWPDGQTDRTARQGPRHDEGVRLLDLLTTSVPAGMQSPTDLKPVDGTQFAGDLRSHQAQFAGETGGKQIWEYMVSIPVGANGKWGRLLAEVHIAGNSVPGAGCELTATFWGMGGNCQLVSVGDKQVGVAVRATGDDQFDQWASYRHPDGTVVYLAQAKTYAMSGLPGLAQLPLTPQQLAELVVDPKFHLD